MNIRRTVILSAVAIAIAAAPVITGVAAADPPPSPSPTPVPAETNPYRLPSWVTEEAREIVANAAQEAGYGPEQANEIAQRIMGHYLP